MILIFSIRNDHSTSLVTEWLERYNKKYIRINGDDETTRIGCQDFNNNELIIFQNNKAINISEATSLWYRRRGFTLKSLPLNRKSYYKEVLKGLPRYHVRHNENELTAFLDYLFYLLQDKCKVLGNYFASDVNKLQVLDLAKKHGFIIPASYVVTQKSDLETLLKNNGNLITKAISDGVYVFTRKLAYYSYTEKLTIKSLSRIPDTFFPSLIQVEIKKKYELRVFCLYDKVYSMAIFSQKDKKSRVDFRRNYSAAARSVPYNLPTDISDKLLSILKELKLNTGSFDLIVDENNNYVFLEVNPVGQFNMTSQPCNYYLEREIAQLL